MDNKFANFLERRMENVRYSRTRESLIEKHNEVFHLTFNPKEDNIYIKWEDEDLRLTTFDDHFNPSVECSEEGLETVLKVFEMLGWVIKEVIESDIGNPTFVLIR